MAREHRRRQSERGFTLMELLVALTLLGMLMAALFGGLRLGTRVWQVSSERQESQSRTLAVRNFLQQRLEETEPVAYAGQGRGQEPVFAGDRDRLTLASSMPESLGPGIFLLELTLRRSDGDPRAGDLLLRWRPLRPSADETEGLSAREDGLADGDGERVLIEDVAALDITYFGAADDGAANTWQHQWRRARFVPELIRIELRFPPDDPRRWLPLIVSPMIDEWYDPTS